MRFQAINRQTHPSGTRHQRGVWPQQSPCSASLTRMQQARWTSPIRSERRWGCRCLQDRPLLLGRKAQGDAPVLRFLALPAGEQYCMARRLRRRYLTAHGLHRLRIRTRIPRVQCSC